MQTILQSDFERLYRPALPAARSFARKLTHNSEDAEDLLQDATLRALGGFARFSGHVCFKTWFFTILKHRHIDLSIRRGLVQFVPIETMEFLMDGDASDPMAAAMQQEGFEALSVSIGGLPAKFRNPLLAFAAGQTYEQIAQEAGIPLGTVKTRVFRARSLLKARLCSHPPAPRPKV